MVVEKRLTGRKLAKRYITLYNLKLRKQKCLKVKHEVLECNLQDKTRKEKYKVSKLEQIKALKYNY